MVTQGDWWHFQGTFVNPPKGRTVTRWLILMDNKLFTSFELKILSGRLVGDLLGNFTHLNLNNGESTIDYIVWNESLYKCVKDFMVLPYEISDHWKILTVFKSSILTQDLTEDKYKWIPLNKKFKWNTKKKRKFVSKY